MYKLLLVLIAGCMLACNNSANEKKTTVTAKSSTGLPADSMAREATFSFIDGCMQNAKLTLGDQKAFAFCKCIYDQLKAQNPGADSIAIEELATDTARVSTMAAKCR